MKRYMNHIREYIHKNRDDFKYLIYIGLPGGILLILISSYLSFKYLI
jgi:hypothetical protein